ncbi:hypothetical protein [Sphaerimonospora thailandensis]|uniref:Uncharacterized protein n=1 Tax=Sphaerimonospora thailandensis TaxID=795644 RepID=A0A8J3VYR3_9ACTN|nr:hypothetical protein [Sphaerimonospora thailandensis]GIH69737.1 hypothetical protein Mth01_19900 [Sphaerimonospora thailandensis]
MIRIEDCLSEAMSIPGALHAVLVNHASGTAVAMEGAAEGAAEGTPDPARAAAGMTEAFRAMLDGIALASAGGRDRIEDAIITTETSYHLIRPLEMAVDGPLLLCLRLDMERANLALARLRLRTLAHEVDIGRPHEAETALVLPRRVPRPPPSGIAGAVPADVELLLRLRAALEALP